jgi:FMN phosphatase YigB (HAD superfamily)
VKIEAAIFDIGNVLLLFDYMKAANRLARKNGLESLPDRARITEANHEFELGRTTRAQFLSAVRREFHDTGGEEEFVAIWEDIFEENTRMTAFARDLSGRIPVFLVSNIGEIHHRYIFRKFEVFSVFRDRIFSYLDGIMKPDPAVFELAKSRFDVNPPSTLYIDDIQENCAAARAAGFLGLHYDHGRQDLPQAWKIETV